EIAGDGGPGAAEVGGLDDVRLEIAALEIVEGHVDGMGVGGRRVDVGHVSEIGDARELVDLAPGLRAVFGDLHQAVVGADEEQSFFERRFGQRRAGSVFVGEFIFPNRVGSPDLAHHGDGVAVDGAREIPRNQLPASAAIVAAHQAVAGDIQARVVVWADDEGNVPARAQLGVVDFARRGGRWRLPAAPAAAGLRVDARADAGLEVEAHAVDLLGAGVDDGGIVLVGARLVAIAAAGVHPIGSADAGAVGSPRRDALRAVVLGAPVNVVKRQAVVHRHAIELRHRNVVEVAPGAAVVVGLIESAVVAFDQVLRVGGIEDQGVVIGVDSPTGALDGLTAVFGDEHVDIHAIDAVVLRGVGEDFAIVFGVLDFEGSAARPVGAGVVGPVEAAHLFDLGSHDEGVHHVRLLPRTGQRDAAHVHGGQAVFELGPVRAAVGGLEDAGLRATGHHHAGIAAALVSGRVDHVGIARIDIDIGDAGVFGDLEQGLPRLAAIGGLVQAAVAAGRKKRPLSGHPHDVGVALVDEDFGDVLGVFEPHVLPGAAGVGALVDAVAIADGALGFVLTSAQPDGIGVVRVDGDAAQRVGAAVIEDGIEGDAAIGGFPEAAGGRRDVPDVAIVGVDGNVGDAPGSERSGDVAHLDFVKQFRGESRRGGWLGESVD